MQNASLKTKIIGAVVAIAAILGLIARFGFYTPQNEIAPIVQQETDTERPLLLSTEPSLKDDPILLPQQSITFHFNQQLVNEPETRIRFDPVVEFTSKLSADYKSITITPKDAYSTGKGYSVFISDETDFRNGRKIDIDYNFHFRTPSYRGI